MVSWYRAAYETLKQSSWKVADRTCSVLSSSRWTRLKTFHYINGVIFAEHDKCDSNAYWICEKKGKRTVGVFDQQGPQIEWSLWSCLLLFGWNYGRSSRNWRNWGCLEHHKIQLEDQGWSWYAVRSNQLSQKWGLQLRTEVKGWLRWSQNLFLY